MVVSESSFLCNIEIKERAEDDKYIPCLKIVSTLQDDRTVTVPSPWGYRKMTTQCLCKFMKTAGVSCGDLAGSLRLSQEPTVIFWPK